MMLAISVSFSIPDSCFCACAASAQGASGTDRSAWLPVERHRPAVTAPSVVRAWCALLLGNAIRLAIALSCPLRRRGDGHGERRPHMRRHAVRRPRRFFLALWPDQVDQALA